MPFKHNATNIAKNFRRKTKRLTRTIQHNYHNQLKFVTDNLETKDIIKSATWLFFFVGEGAIRTAWRFQHMHAKGIKKNQEISSCS